MEKICRVCMGTKHSGAFTNIFDETQKGASISIADMISECTGYVVRRGDSLSEKICPNCLEDAVSAFKLKKTCERSHKLFFTLMEEGRDADEDRKQSDSRNQFETDEAKQDDCKRRFQCSFCTESFARKSQLCGHTRIHAGERPYKCRHCPKSFKHKSNLQLHIRSETADRPFKCSHCCRSFKQSAYLRMHIIRIHTSETPNHQCPQCTRAFPEESNLKRHMRMHTEERPHKCSECSKSFIHKYKLERHVSTHSKDRPYKCSHCSKSYKQNKHLIAHIHHIHPAEEEAASKEEQKKANESVERPYLCTHCSKLFKQHKHLISHICIRNATGKIKPIEGRRVAESFESGVRTFQNAFMNYLC
ncbi:oocyte zinc finger protein XlCOF6.1-like [Drosophila obscura]|uniref:oocyte zinc finger protein XlCOF6.1-like n=1 Tax=Drosophila obscura TaxID=7282 RepID=UPI001BB28437|nr:oocyte zinc finger protein XlCOF6.1-like [Drosophila obscura]